MTSNCPGIISGYDTRKILDPRSHPTRRQALQKRSSITLGAQTRIENREHAAVCRAANQTSETLLERDDRLRHAVLVKTRAAAVLDRSLSRRHDRISRHRERQFVDDHARQLFAAHVDALPETRCREQHRVRRLAKLFY